MLLLLKFMSTLYKSMYKDVYFAAVNTKVPMYV